MWPFNYFKKKREKEEQERRRAEEQARQQKLEEERIARERERRLEENRRKELERQAKLKAEREQKESIQPFTFRSNCHQRYENDTPVMGLQECIRTVSMVKNTDGCPGYKLAPGVGYIVKIYNDDLGKPNMSDKPMKVVKKTADMVELRGFPIEARSPFGWQEVDYSDYGFVVYYKNGQVEKCVLHMYDRNIRLEYMTKSASSSTAKTNSYITNAPESNKLTETETLVKEALSNLRAGRDGDDTYHPLFKAWRSFQRAPEQLKKIQDEGSFGTAFMIFLSYGTVSDIDDKQQLASIAYLFLSKAIEKNGNDVNLYKNRILLMMLNDEAFGYTVLSAINPGGGFDIFSMNLHPFESRDAIYKMEIADLELHPQLYHQVSFFKERKDEFDEMIGRQFFMPEKTLDNVISSGVENHKKLLYYLENRIINEEDVDF